MTPIKAIRANCLDCMCGQQKEVRLCPSTDCPLYPYRMGHRPKIENYTAGNLNAEECEDSPAFFENGGES